VTSCFPFPADGQTSFRPATVLAAPCSQHRWMTFPFRLLQVLMLGCFCFFCRSSFQLESVRFK
jgi:hypothetical protein